MSNVGQQLRTAREALGLTVYQIAETTKIRTDHIRALEEGNYNMFAAPVYIRGFVRAYAKLVRLDAVALAAALEAELGQNERFREPPSLGGPSWSFLDLVMLQLSKVNWRVALPALGVGLVLLVAILGYRIVRNRQAKDPLANLGPGLYQPPQKNPGETLPLPAPRK